MHAVRDRRGNRALRAAATAAVLAVLAVLLPAAQADARPPGASITLVSGSEEIGSSATYSFVCYDDGTNGAPIWWINGTQPNSGQLHSITSFTRVDGVLTGTYTATFDTFTEGGGGTMWMGCGWPGSEGGRELFFGPTKTATSTTLQPSSFPGVLGDTVTLTATVTGADGGDVTFTAGSRTLGTVPVTSGTASLTYTVVAGEVLTAAYSGTETAQASSSTGLDLQVITEVAGPQGLGLSTWTAVGMVQVPGTTLQDWSPSGVTLSYDWQVDGVTVSHDPTYVPTATQVGQELTVTVTGSRAPLAPLSRTSVPAEIRRGTIQTGALALDGTADGHAVLGQTITPRGVDFGADAQLSFEWYVGDRAPFTAPSYTPTAADLGLRIAVVAVVTAPGKAETSVSAAALPAAVRPTVTVGSSTITLGTTAVVPVTVSGPQGAPVPTGTVDLVLTRAGDGTEVEITDVVLDGSGAATVRVPDLAVGTYAATVTYLPPSSARPAYAVTTEVDLSSDPYVTATGSGTVRVTKVVPAVSAPATLTVPVATPASFQVTVTGPARPTSYVVREGTTVLGQGTLGEDGVIAVTLPVLAAGVHQIVVDLPETARTAATSRTVALTVGGEPVRSGALPTAELDTPKAATAPGQQMELVAEGFEPGETVAFYLHSDPVFLGTAVADANGVARLLADIPADVPTGAHTVIATGGTSGRWATLAVELAVPAATPAAADAATPAASGADLAQTGAQTGPLMLGAWLLLLVGGGLVLVTRRVRAAR